MMIGSKEKAQSGFSKVDIILAIAIAASIGFIGYRYLKTSHPTATANLPAVAEGEVAVVSTTGVPVNDKYRDRKGMWILEDMKRVDEAAFLAAVKDAKLEDRLVKATAGCQTETSPAEATIRMSHRNILDIVEQGKINMMLGFFSPVQPCYRSGESVELISYDRSAKGKLADLGGKVRLKHILVIAPEEVPEALLQLMGIDREAYLFFTNLRRKAGVPDYLILFDEFKKVEPPSTPRPSFMYTKILTKAQLKEADHEKLNIQIVDVRSPEEFAKGSVPGAINIPVTLPAGVSSKFSWTLSNSELVGAKFDIVSFLSNREKGIVVVGSNPSDVRPLVALALMYDLSLNKFGWIYEGVE